jgi:hypothetical protein
LALPGGYSTRRDAFPPLWAAEDLNEACFHGEDRMARVFLAQNDKQLPLLALSGHAASTIWSPLSAADRTLATWSIDLNL